MNELKYQITQFIFLALLAVGAYWALTHLDNGISYSRDHIVQHDEISDTTSDITLIDDDTDANDEELVPEDTSTNEEPVTEETATSPELSSSEKELVTSLGRLIDDNIYMKVGSRGTRVGTVQEFLGYYFPDKSISIDNDYGPGTKSLVEQFQVAEGLTADGQAGPVTYQTMIDVIEE